MNARGRNGQLFLAPDSSMLSAYFEVKSSISTSGFARATKNKKSAPKRKGSGAKDSCVVEAAEPDETTAVRHARVRDVDDDLRGFMSMGVGESSVTSASGSLVSGVRGSGVAEDIITEDTWEHLWDDKAGDDPDCEDRDDEYGGEEEDCTLGGDPDEDTVLLLDSMRDPEADDFDSVGQSSQLNVSPEVFRKSLERKASSSACAAVEYSGPKLTLEDDNF